MCYFIIADISLLPCRLFVVDTGNKWLPVSKSVRWMYFQLRKVPRQSQLLPTAEGVVYDPIGTLPVFSSRNSSISSIAKVSANRARFND